MREMLKSEKSEVYKWKDLVKELRSLLDGKNDEIERKREEVRKLYCYSCLAMMNVLLHTMNPTYSYSFLPIHRKQVCHQHYFGNYILRKVKLFVAINFDPSLELFEGKRQIMGHVIESLESKFSE